MTQEVERLDKRPQNKKTEKNARLPHEIKKKPPDKSFPFNNYEEIHKKIIMASHEAIIMCGLDGTLLYCSERTASTHGFPSVETMTGMNIFDLFAPQDRDRVKKDFNRVEKEGFVGGREYRMLKRKNGDFTASLNAAVVNDASGRPFAIIVTFYDVTVSKEIRKKLFQSEELYRSLFENANDIIILREITEKGAPGRILEANGIVQEKLGFTPGEVKKFTPRELFEREEISGRDKIQGELFKKGMAVFEEAMFSKAGARVIFEVSAHLINYNGKKAIMAICRDITARKKTEEKIRESRELYKKLVETSPDAVIAADIEGRVVFASGMALEMFGAGSGGGMEGKDIFDYVSPEDRRACEKALEDVFREGKMKNREFVFLRSGGDRFVGELRSSLVLDSTDKPAYILVVLRDITEKKKSEAHLKESYRSVKKIMDGIIHSMEMLVEKKDVYTVGHQHRTAQLAGAIASDMGMAGEHIECISIAAVIHDIGKIFVSGSILNKKGGLTEAEFEIIKKHPEAGYDVLKSIEFPWPVADIIRQHHERLDGSGYPRGLKGDEIFLESRIISVADVVEAMTFKRPYRPALGIDAALAEIEKGRGALYDSEAVDICVSLFREKGFEFEETPDVL